MQIPNCDTNILRPRPESNRDIPKEIRTQGGPSTIVPRGLSVFTTMPHL